MNRKFFYIIIPLVAALAVFWFVRGLSVPKDAGPSSDLVQYTNAAFGLSFSYPASYVLKEMDAPGSALRLNHVITLTPQKDLPLPVNGEGPPSIVIDIYQNDLDHQTTDGWIRNSSASNFKLGDGNLTSTTLGGSPALSYRWSGLYEGTTIVTAQAKWIYAFTVTYLAIGDSIVQDFVTIRDSAQIAH